MGNDGRRLKAETDETKLEVFNDFEAWDKLSPSIRDKKYEEFINEFGAGVACQALHEFEIFKKRKAGG